MSPVEVRLPQPRAPGAPSSRAEHEFHCQQADMHTLYGMSTWRHGKAPGATQTGTLRTHTGTNTTRSLFVPLWLIRMKNLFVCPHIPLPTCHIYGLPSSTTWIGLLWYLEGLGQGTLLVLWGCWGSLQSWASCSCHGAWGSAICHHNLTGCISSYLPGFKA